MNFDIEEMSAGQMFGAASVALAAVSVGVVMLSSAVLIFVEIVRAVMP